MKEKEFQERLVRRYINNQASEEELEVYFHLLRQGKLDDLMEKYMKERENAADGIRMIRTSPARRLWIRTAAAAAAVIFLGVGIFLFLPRKVQREEVLTSDVAPGGNKATLTLSDGQTISLTEAASGELAVESGVLVRKASDGQLVYEAPAAAAAAREITYNTITTPRGGQYQVVLPDGSRVWLNAASSLRYPASFAGMQERRVELTGEAYFEVAKDARKPFSVSSAQQTVKVLGTHFNVNAYTDEPVVKTTLLEGSVRVEPAGGAPGVTLSPGHQAIRAADGFRVLKVDAPGAIGWKNGKFVFDGESLESILRRVSRWYDVEIEYKDAQTKKILFGGTMSRFDHISKVLSKLEITGDVQFEIVQEAGASSPKIIVNQNHSI